METELFDAVVIGSGEAGKYLAWHLGDKGEKVIVVDRGYVGGSCPNIACLPSKNILHSAAVAHTVRNAGAFGTRVDGMHVNMEEVRKRKRAMVQSLVEMHWEKFRAAGVELLLGEAVFCAPRTVDVTLPDGSIRRLAGSRVFLNTGSRAALPEIQGLKEAQPLTHVEALELGELPEHLVVLGGGYVGIEFAQAYRRFGSRVTLVQRGTRLLEQGDEDASTAILQLLRDEGVTVLLNASVNKVTGSSGQSVTLHIVAPDGSSKDIVEGSHLLVTTGREPGSASLNLRATGVETDERGFIAVNERLETSAAGVWAMGDCTGGPMFTHASYDDFRIVREQLAGGNRTTKNRLLPWTLFTDPELAHVGLSEQDAKAKGVTYRLLTMPMKSVLRTRTTGETRGYLKALIGDDDRVLGFTAFGAGAGETLATVQTAMLAGLPYTALADAIFTHPTLAEGLVLLFSGKPK